MRAIAARSQRGENDASLPSLPPALLVFSQFDMLADLNTAIRTPLALVQSVYAQEATPTLDGLEKRVESAFSELFSDASALAQVRAMVQKAA